MKVGGKIWKKNEEFNIIRFRKKMDVSENEAFLPKLGILSSSLGGWEWNEGRNIIF